MDWGFVTVISLVCLAIAFFIVSIFWRRFKRKKQHEYAHLAQEDSSNEAMMEMRAFVQKFSPKLGTENVMRQLHEAGFTEAEIKRAFAKQ